MQINKMFFSTCVIQIQTNVSPTQHTNPQTHHFTELVLFFMLKSNQIYLKSELKGKGNELSVYSLIVLLLP